MIKYLAKNISRKARKGILSKVRKGFALAAFRPLTYCQFSFVHYLSNLLR